MTDEDVSGLRDFWNTGVAGVQDEHRGLSRRFCDINARGDRPEVKGGGAAGYQEKIRGSGDDIDAGGGVGSHVYDGKRRAFLLGAGDGVGKGCRAGFLDCRKPFDPRALPGVALIGRAGLRVGVD